MIPEDCTPLEAALTYASLGLPVIPLYTPNADGTCSCPDPKCKDIGKHPRISKWSNDASTDPDIIRRWWGWWPEANVSILTGKRSGIIVIDIDDDAGGWDSMAKLVDAHGELGTTPVVLTGGGGMHIYFQHPGDRVIKNSAGEIAAGVDLRGDGGMAIAPPSLHASGNRYKWDELVSDDGELSGGKLAPLPSWLLPRTSRSTTSTTNTSEDSSAPFIEGHRNKTLTSIAGAMRRHGAPEEAILAALIATNSARCDPPLDDAEVERISRSVSRYTPAPILLAGGLPAIRSRRPEMRGGVRRG